MRDLQLPDWQRSDRLLWPPRQTPFAVTIAESMAAAPPDPRYSGDWWRDGDARRTAVDEEQARVAQHYEAQARLREERERQSP